ncbi:MAG: DUF4406 domain-containing protein [Acetivibrio ethanolgignens]
MKIYISGPVSGTKDANIRFAAAEAALEAEGHEVINPVKVNGQLPEQTTYREYMNMSFMMLDMCDCIFMLKGWQESQGARMELGQALKSGHTIVFEGGRGSDEKNQTVAV